MASAFSHIAVPIAGRLGLGQRVISTRLLLLGMFLSVMPDFDSIAFRFDIPYESQWGHRGFTHSILFAVLISLLLMRFSQFFKFSWWVIFVYSFVSTVSHGIFDALTNGGLGVAFFWPFNTERFFFPWQVIEVSPISVARFFTEKGVVVLKSEAVTIWAPCLLMSCGLAVIKYKRSQLKSERE